MAFPVANPLSRVNWTTVKETGLHWLSTAWALIRRYETRSFRPDPGRMEEAIRANRSFTLAFAMLWFMTSLTLDDLGILRLPAYMVAVVGALFIFAVYPVLSARTMTYEYRERGDGSFESKAGEKGRLGALALIGTIILAILWLIVFTAGVPPWAN